MPTPRLGVPHIWVPNGPYMASTDPILHLLQAKGAVGIFDSEGNFKINKDALKDRYASLLDDDGKAVLFFVQAAHRWDALGLDLKILKNQFVARIALPEESSLLKRLNPNPHRALEAFFPHDHPLFELAQGYNILAHAESTRDIELSIDQNGLCVRWDFQGRRSILSSTRAKLSSLIYGHVIPDIPVTLDGKPLSLTHFPSSYLHQQYAFGDVPIPTPVVICQSDVLKAWSLTDDQSKILEVPESDSSSWMMPSDHEGGPVFLNQIEEGEPAVYYFPKIIAKDGAKIIPVRYGVLMEIVALDQSYGPAITLVQAETLKTDLSGLRLVEDEAYSQALENAKLNLRAKLEVIKSIHHHYQPQVDRQKLFKKALKVSALTPPTLALGMVFGGVGALLKSAVVLKAIAGTFPLGILYEARSLVDPAHYTESQRQAKFAWLTPLL